MRIPTLASLAACIALDRPVRCPQREGGRLRR